MSQVLSASRSDTDEELLQVKGAIESISNDLHEKIDALILDTRKETGSNSLEVNAKSKSLVEEMHKHKHRKRVVDRKAGCLQYLPIASHGNFRQLMVALRWWRKGLQSFEYW